MLLNLSNHPYDTWSGEQKQAAINQYGSVKDLPFPQVDPMAASSQIQQLADEYVARIRKLAPSAVHVMGELTFCHALVNRLQKAGITCVASTTNRKVWENANGNIEKRFEFVQFRGYLPA